MLWPHSLPTLFKSKSPALKLAQLVPKQVNPTSKQSKNTNHSGANHTVRELVTRTVLLALTQACLHHLYAHYACYEPNMNPPVLDMQPN